MVENDPRGGTSGNAYSPMYPFTSAPPNSAPYVQFAQSTPLFRFGSYDQMHTPMPSLHLHPASYAPGPFRHDLHTTATSYPLLADETPAGFERRHPYTGYTDFNPNPRDYSIPLDANFPSGNILRRDLAHTYTPIAGDGAAEPPTVERLQSRLDTAIRELETTKAECANLRNETPV